MEVVGVADAVEAGDGGYDDDVAPAAHQGAGGTDPELVDLLVDAQVLFNIGVRRRDVGLGLIVVVVGDEVFDGVAGEEGFHLAVELGREGLVVAEDEGGALEALDDVGHRKGLAGAGYAEERDVADAASQGVTETVYGLGLVAGGAVWSIESELHFGIIADTKLYKKSETGPGNR